MQLLADECCDILIVRTLRELGYEVVYIVETASGSTNQDILAQAYEKQQVVITQDRDFCELVFRDNEPTHGVILIRIPTNQRNRKPERVKVLFANHAEQLANAMTTLTLSNIKIRPLRKLLIE